MLPRRRRARTNGAGFRGINGKSLPRLRTTPPPMMLRHWLIAASSLANRRTRPLCSEPMGKTSLHLSGRYGKPWTANAVRQRIARLKKQCDLPADVCAYLIRHAFGTNAVMNGVNLASVLTTKFV